MSDLPKPYRRFIKEFPAVGEAFDRLGAAAHDSGPLDVRTRVLVKLALSVGARSQGAVHSHTHRAVALGISPAEIKHVVTLAVTTVGLPGAMAAYTWVNDILDPADA